MLPCTPTRTHTPEPRGPPPPGPASRDPGILRDPDCVRARRPPCGERLDRPGPSRRPPGTDAQLPSPSAVLDPPTGSPRILGDPARVLSRLRPPACVSVGVGPVPVLVRSTVSAGPWLSPASGSAGSRAHHRLCLCFYAVGRPIIKNNSGPAGLG